MWKCSDIEKHRNCSTQTIMPLFNHKHEYPVCHWKTGMSVQQQLYVTGRRECLCSSNCVSLEDGNVCVAATHCTPKQ